MKLLVVTSRFPYPIEKGDKLRLYYQIIELSKHFEVSLFTLSDHLVEKNDREKILQYCDNIQVIELNKLNKIFQVFKSIFTRTPAQIALFSSGKAKRALEEYIRHINPDHIYYQLLRTQSYKSDFSCSTTLDLMDAFSYGMNRRAKRSSFPLNLLFLRESKLLEKAEKIALKQYNNLTIISRQDALRIGSDSNVQVVNNGVDLEYYQMAESKSKYDVVFVGNLGYKPNIEAAKYLVKKISPAYLNHYSRNLNIGIYGARPSSEVLNLATKNVSVLGWIEDIRNAYLAGKILVAPIFGGMGQQNKLLEALALGIPSIVSSEIANGLSLTDGQNCIIASNEEEFAHAIESLLTNNQLYTKLRIQGRKFVEDNYAWDKVILPLVKLIKNS